ncbi:MAG: fibrobacter succinogenes major paralogous domain-containing protein, partial [Bacteroidales bacterium]|nr:fibrobacter succinogenes major paralogous domain-containing protein [Bacteroidales bacterium]
GEYPMELSSTDFANTNPNFDNVTFTIVDAQLKINPIDVVVTITEHGDTLDYDGALHMEIGSASWRDSVQISVVAVSLKNADTVSGTNVGEYPMELSSTDFANTNPNFDNVTFTIVDAQLKINPIDVVVTIIGHNSTDTYDGSLHTVTGYDVTAIEIGGVATTLYTEADFSLAAGVEATASRTNVGTTDMGLTSASFVNNNPNFNTVTFNVLDGYQAVSPRNVILTSEDATREYNGEWLTNHNVIVGGDGFATGEGATYDVTGQQLLPGSSDNTFTYTLNGGTLAENYNITTVYGTLTVNDRSHPYEIEVVANSYSTTYDAEYHTAAGFVTLEFVVEGNTYTVSGLTTSNPNSRNACDLPNAISGTAVVSDAAGNDVTAQFTVTTTDGALKIAKRQILISGEKFKHFDNEVLSINYSELTVTPALYGTDHLTGGIITTESAAQGVYTCTEGGFNYMMELTAVKVPGSFAMENSDHEDVIGNYEPEFAVTLTIGAPAVTIDCGTPQTVVLKDCEEYVNIVDLTAPDMVVAAGVVVTVTPSIPSGLTTLTPGTYAVTWTVTDDAGHFLVACDQTVTVEYPSCDPVLYIGHPYNVIRIGSQCWMTENLRNTVDGHGNPVVNFRAVNDDPATVEDYGYLYSWYSAVGVAEGDDATMPTTYPDECGGTYVQGICPTGWAVPSQEDVNKLRAAIGDEANVLKTTDPQYWLPGSAGVTPNTEFNARAEGLYNSATERFEKALLYAYFWESGSQPNISEVLSAVIAYYCDNVMEEISPKSDLRPVRCVRKVAP